MPTESDFTQSQNINLLDKRLHIVEIIYCTQCHWLMRAAWMGQELLTTFEADIKSLNLAPGAGGIFDVRLNGALIFSRKQAGRFPESKELKQLIRDQIEPTRDLGHSDVKISDVKDNDVNVSDVKI